MSDDFGKWVEIRDEETLNAVVAHWQKVLRLQDYTFDVYFCSACDMQHEGDIGECCVSRTSRAAQIKILNPTELLAMYRAGSGRKFYPRFPMENTVVHEMLHVYTAECELNDHDDRHIVRAMEKMVDGLAFSLTSLHSYFETPAPFDSVDD